MRGSKLLLAAIAVTQSWSVATAEPTMIGPLPVSLTIVDQQVPLAASAELDIHTFASELQLQVKGKLTASADDVREALRTTVIVANVDAASQTVLAIEMVKDKKTRTPFPWPERRGLAVYRHALERGALLRPLGDVIYFMPPYVIAPEEIDFLAKVAREGIDRAVA